MKCNIIVWFQKRNEWANNPISMVILQIWLVHLSIRLGKTIKYLSGFNHRSASQVSEIIFFKMPIIHFRFCLI